MNETLARIALAKVPHLGAVRIRQLIMNFESAQEALHATEDALRALPGFGPAVINSFFAADYLQQAEEEMELAERNGIDLITCDDPSYPRLLKKLPDAPVLLYVKGTLTPQDAQGLAIVGTRQATIYGREMAASFARDLASAGFTVVSGLARGIDTAAHTGALERGRTIGVIGSGLLRLYPQENEQLAERIVANGALISEFPLLAPPDRQNFPQRNRIVSGMTRAALLIEAPLKSGAMQTMRRSIKEERPTFALPGRVDQENFRGNHALLKAGDTQLVETAGEIASYFDTLFPQRAVMNKKNNLNSTEMTIMNALNEGERGVDEITRLTGLPTVKVNILLMSLLLKKAIKEYPGKIYKKAS